MKSKVTTAASTGCKAGESNEKRLTEEGVGGARAPESDGPEAHGLNPTTLLCVDLSPSKTQADVLTPGT